MSDINHEEHCSRWSGIPQAKQTEFTRRAVGLLVTAYRTGVYNLPVLWKRVDWRYGNGVSFILGNRPALASWDFNQLTRLVIGAHDECIRVEVEPHGFGYLKVNMWPRKGRDGQMYERHPSIEDAISDYRIDNPSPVPSLGGDTQGIVDRLRAVEGNNRRLCLDAAMMVEHLCRQAAPRPGSGVDIEAEIERVVQTVNEWDDRTSPDEYPEHLLITSEELTLILRNFAATMEGRDNG